MRKLSSSRAASLRSCIRIAACCIFIAQKLRPTGKRGLPNLQKAIADFKTSIRLGAASKDELNRGLEKIATRANLEEVTKLLAEETGR